MSDSSSSDGSPTSHPVEDDINNIEDLYYCQDCSRTSANDSEFWQCELNSAAECDGQWYCHKCKDCYLFVDDDESEFWCCRACLHNEFPNHNIVVNKVRTISLNQWYREVTLTKLAQPVLPVDDKLQKSSTPGQTSEPVDPPAPYCHAPACTKTGSVSSFWECELKLNPGCNGRSYCHTCKECYRIEDDNSWVCLGCLRCKYPPVAYIVDRQVTFYSADIWVRTVHLVKATTEPREINELCTLEVPQSPDLSGRKVDNTPKNPVEVPVIPPPQQHVQPGLLRYNFDFPLSKIDTSDTVPPEVVSITIPHVDQLYAKFCAYVKGPTKTESGYSAVKGRGTELFDLLFYVVRLIRAGSGDSLLAGMERILVDVLRKDTLFVAISNIVQDIQGGFSDARFLPSLMTWEVLQMMKHCGVDSPTMVAIRTLLPELFIDGEFYWFSKVYSDPSVSERLSFSIYWEELPDTFSMSHRRPSSPAYAPSSPPSEPPESYRDYLKEKAAEKATAEVAVDEDSDDDPKSVVIQENPSKRRSSGKERKGKRVRFAKE